MEGTTLGLVIGIPLIIFPALFIWYLNTSGILTVIRETRKRRIAREKRARAAQKASL